MAVGYVKDLRTVTRRVDQSRELISSFLCLNVIVSDYFDATVGWGEARH